MPAASPERTEARRRQVLDAAVELFSECGYRATSMHGLAARVGLSKPALYHYVQSKERVLVELYEEVLHESVTAVHAIAASELDVAAALREVIVQRVAYTCEKRNLLRVFFEEEAELPRPMLRTVLRDRRAYEDALLALVARGVQEGVFVLPCTPRVFVNAVLGAANWVYKWYDPAGALSPRELGAQIADAMLAGLSSGVRPVGRK
ncbi:MAG TPA: TetR/AcrR family transcriptional regulator [Solirubrobacteraceae bacterium]|jgi:AcrR family transcriptional regulator|nr:TetR/AcrR family transcriptional regulator [Solirubrobacteraceae bacterium]